MSKVVHPKYWKTLKRSCSEEPFGQMKNVLVSGRLACMYVKKDHAMQCSNLLCGLSMTDYPETCRKLLKTGGLRRFCIYFLKINEKKRHGWKFPAGFLLLHNSSLTDHTEYFNLEILIQFRMCFHPKTWKKKWFNTYFTATTNHCGCQKIRSPLAHLGCLTLAMSLVGVVAWFKERQFWQKYVHKGKKSFLCLATCHSKCCTQHYELTSTCIKV